MNSFRRVTLGFVSAAFLGIYSVLAHSGEDPAEGVTLNVRASPTDPAFPVNVGGEFSLIDHEGRRRTEKDFGDKYLLVYFGYVNCKAMCPITLSRIGAAIRALGERAADLAPIVVTVDPQRDTPALLKRELPKYHPDLIGLTGSESELAQAYRAYDVRPTPHGKDWEDDAIVQHTSYIYLIGPQGEFKTLFPPIIRPSVMAEIMLKYMNPEA